MKFVPVHIVNSSFTHSNECHLNIFIYCILSMVHDIICRLSMPPILSILADFVPVVNIADVGLDIYAS